MPNDSLKQRFIEDVMLNYLGNFISSETVLNYASFFDRMLAEVKTDLSEVNRIMVFPSDLEDTNDEVSFSNCVLYFRMKEERNKVFNLILVLDNELRFIGFKEFLYAKKLKDADSVNLVSEVYGVREGVFRVTYYVKNQLHSQPLKQKQTDTYAIKKKKIVRLRRMKHPHA